MALKLQPLAVRSLEELPGRCWALVAAGWYEDSTLDHPGQTPDTPAGLSLSAKKKENAQSISYLWHDQYILPPLLSAVSPCWSGLGGACSRLCRGRGICWFVRRPVGLEPPAPGQWRPAWRGDARHRDQHQVPLAPPLPALLLPPGRTHAGRTPGGQKRLKCVGV